MAPDGRVLFPGHGRIREHTLDLREVAGVSGDEERRMADLLRQVRGIQLGPSELVAFLRAIHWVRKAFRDGSLRCGAWGTKDGRLLFAIFGKRVPGMDALTTSYKVDFSLPRPPGQCVNAGIGPVYGHAVVRVGAVRAMWIDPVEFRFAARYTPWVDGRPPTEQDIAMHAFCQRLLVRESERWGRRVLERIHQLQRSA